MEVLLLTLDSVSHLLLVLDSVAFLWQDSSARVDLTLSDVDVLLLSKWTSNLALDVALTTNHLIGIIWLS